MATTDCHRNVCQLLLDRGVYKEDELAEAWQEVVGRYPKDAKRAKLSLKHDEVRDRETLMKVVDSCNESLEPLGLKIAKMKQQDRDSKAWITYYGIVNLVEDDKYATQTWMSKSEQEFFHKLVAEILGSDPKELESSLAIAIGRDLESTTKLAASEAEKCLERLTHGQWLALSNEGYYSLGVRTELQRRYMSEDIAAAASQTADPAANVENLDDA